MELITETDMEIVIARKVPKVLVVIYVKKVITNTRDVEVK